MLVALVLAGCGTPAPGIVAGALLPSCDDFPSISAPASWYRSAPVYVANEMPTDDVREWAMGRPGFEEIWIDRDHQGWVTVGFSSGAADRQAELADAFPGVGVVAVDVPHTRAELEGLAARIIQQAAELRVTFVSAAIHRGVVMVGVGVREPARVAALAGRFPGEPLCVDGIDPADAPPAGPQAAEGDGWRLLGHAENVGPGYRTGIAADGAAYDALWQEAGLGGDPQPVDFATEVAVWFSAVTGSSCPDLRLDAVIVDLDRGLVHADIVHPEVVGACTADIYPHSFLVALSRARLPAGPFAVQLGPEDPPAGVPEERTVVDADLTGPRATPGAGAVHPDASLLDPEPQAAVPGDIVEPGFEPLFRFPVACGVEWLGPLNDTWWRTADPVAMSGRLPDVWAAAVDADGSLTAAISITLDAASVRPPTMDVEVGGVRLRYTAVAGASRCR